MRYKMKYGFACFLLLLLTFSAVAQNESDYSNMFQKALGGQREYSVTSGYVDLLTETHAIEVEFANKWKQSIGQALWYGQQTLKAPGIILILRKPSDYKYFIQLNTALDYGDLSEKIKVWIYPHDFPGLDISDSTAQPKLDNTPNDQNSSNVENTNRFIPATRSFWLTKSSGIRHNSSCRYHGSTRGSNCEPNEGRACKKCGG